MESTTMGSESEADRVRSIMQDISEGKNVGQKLIYDKHTKKLRPAIPNKDPDSTITIRPDDLHVYVR